MNTSQAYKPAHGGYSPPNIAYVYYGVWDNRVIYMGPMIRRPQVEQPPFSHEKTPTAAEPAQTHWSEGLPPGDVFGVCSVLAPPAPMALTAPFSHEKTLDAAERAYVEATIKNLR